VYWKRSISLEFVLRSLWQRTFCLKIQRKNQEKEANLLYNH